MRRIEKEHLIYHDFDQGSEEWINCRNEYITASAIGKILKDSHTVEYKNLLAEKASNGEHRTFFGNTATRWGHKYEPVADMLFEHKNPGVHIFEYGLIYNPKYPHLGVSPDGITSENEMLEIKCPYSRHINGVIKKEYEHQIQQQLLVCEHEICNFLECKFVELEKDKFWKFFDDSNREKGIIIQSRTRPNGDQGNKEKEKEVRYNYYSPIELSFNREDLLTWYQYRMEDIDSSGEEFVKETYWILEKYNLQKVKRDPNWYVNAKPQIDKFWSEVEKYRKNGWQQLISDRKEKESKFPSVCLLP